MAKIREILNPAVFQGAGKKPPYFEGWYYRVEAPSGRCFATIPGISLSESGSHSFLQLMDSANHSTLYTPFSTGDFIASRQNLNVFVGGSNFTGRGFKIGLQGEPPVTAECEFVNPVYYPSDPLRPGIMGPFSFVPGLACRHAVVVIRSETRGFFKRAGETVSLDGGTAYVEKDWGSSFPERYVWIQASRFEHSGAAFLFSAASVPLARSQFTGVIGFLYFNGATHTFGTYSGAKIETLLFSEGKISALIRLPNARLAIHAEYPGTGVLKAPERGGMLREIRECIRGEVFIELDSSDGRRLFGDYSHNASIETGDNPELLIPDEKGRR